MRYNPGDPQAIVDTTIALDAFIMILVGELAKDAELAPRLVEALDYAIANTPDEIAGIKGRLNDWRDALSGAPISQGQH